MSTSWEHLPSFEHESDEWHEARRSSIGASEVAAVLGLSKWQTPFSVWQTKMGGRHEIPANLAYFGHALEPVISKWIEDHHPEVGPLSNSISIRSTLHPWLTATPDRMAGDIPVELKTSSQDMKRTWVDGPPDYYRIQSIVQQGILGADHGWLAVLHGGNEPELFRIPFDREAWELIVKYTGEWWERHVVAQTPPPAAVTSEIAARWPVAEDVETDLSDTAFETFERRNVLLSDIKSMQAEADGLEIALAEYVQGATTLNYEGRTVATWREQQGRESVRVALLREKFPQIAEQVITRSKPFRVLRTKKETK